MALAIEPPARVVEPLRRLTRDDVRIAHGMGRLAHEFGIIRAKFVIDHGRERDARLALQARSIDAHGADPRQHRRIVAGAEGVDIAEQNRERKRLARPRAAEKSYGQRCLGITVRCQFGQRAQHGAKAKGIGPAPRVGGENTAALAQGGRRRGSQARCAGKAGGKARGDRLGTA